MLHDWLVDGLVPAPSALQTLSETVTPLRWQTTFRDCVPEGPQDALQEPSEKEQTRAVSNQRRNGNILIKENAPQPPVTQVAQPCVLQDCDVAGLVPEHWESLTTLPLIMHRTVRVCVPPSQVAEQLLHEPILQLAAATHVPLEQMPPVLQREIEREREREREGQMEAKHEIRPACLQERVKTNKMHAPANGTIRCVLVRNRACGEAVATVTGLTSKLAPIISKTASRLEWNITGLVICAGTRCLTQCRTADTLVSVGKRALVGSTFDLAVIATLSG